MNRIKNFLGFRPKNIDTSFQINENSGTAELTKNLERRRRKAEDELKKTYPDAKDCVIDITQDKDGKEEISLVCKAEDGTEIKKSFHGDVIGGGTKPGATGSANFGNLGDVLATGVKYLGSTKTKSFYSDKEEYYSKPGEDERSHILRYLGVSDDPSDVSGSVDSGSTSYSSGIDAKSATNLLVNAKKNAPASSRGDIKIPDFAKLGDLGFEESTEYLAMLDALDLKKGKKKRILKSLRKIGLPDLGDGPLNLIVAVRAPVNIKDKFGRDFTDIFICFTEEKERPDFYLGSTTPSPIFRNKDDKKYLISLGFVGLMNQGGPLIVNPTGNSPYVFTEEIDDVFGECFIQKSDIVCQRYKIDDKDYLGTYDPGNSKSGNFGLFFRTANMDGDAEGIDATTYGDLVIRDRSAFLEIVSMYSSRLKIFVVEMADLKKDEEKPEELEEGIRRALKYISRFD